MRSKVGAVFVSLLLATILRPASAEPTACAASRAELEQNKQLVRDFFAFTGPPEARAERFLTEDYIQHNPRLLRMDETTGASGRDAWVKGFHEATRRRIQLVDLGGIRLLQPELLMAECDLVTAIYKGVLNDPDRPGRSYEAFAFETFRIRDGKLAEHWDQVTLKAGWMTPPTPKSDPIDAEASRR